MSAQITAFVASVFLAGGMLGYWWIVGRRHHLRMAAVPVRIHVNGIRGKSTVTRLLAGILREAGYTTVAKTTGTATVVIGPDGRDVPIARRGAATILEQIDIVRDWVDEDCDALVIECMAVRPNLQTVSESQIVRSTISIITNVRTDHHEVMGETLPEIAVSLLGACARDGVLVTGETNPELLDVLRVGAAQRGTSLLSVNPGEVTDRDLEQFPYVAFADNVAIGLAVARMLGISRDVAMKGMVNSAPDPGALMIKQCHIGEKRVTWANLFAVNDRESSVAAVERLSEYRTAETQTVIILNNRSDRERRALQFADVVAFDLHADFVTTFGAYENQVTKRLTVNGYPQSKIINLGETRNPSIDEIVNRLVHNIPGKHVLLIGLVNIHTREAEMLLEYFNRDSGTEDSIEVASIPLPEVAQPDRHMNAQQVAQHRGKSAPGQTPKFRTRSTDLRTRTKSEAAVARNRSG